MRVGCGGVCCYGDHKIKYTIRPWHVVNVVFVLIRMKYSHKILGSSAPVTSHNEKHLFLLSIIIIITWFSYNRKNPIPNGGKHMHTCMICYEWKLMVKFLLFLFFFFFLLWLFALYGNTFYCVSLKRDLRNALQINVSKTHHNLKCYSFSNSKIENLVIGNVRPSA